MPWFSDKVYHNLKDITGAWETSVTMHYAIEIYNSLDSLKNGLKDVTWNGVKSVGITKADLMKHGIWYPETEEYMYPIPFCWMEVPVEKYCVMAWCANDANGNQSDWQYSNKFNPKVPESIQKRYVIYREY
jgi:hypothetical protein